MREHRKPRAHCLLVTRTVAEAEDLHAARLSQGEWIAIRAADAREYEIGVIITPQAVQRVQPCGSQTDQCAFVGGGQRLKQADSSVVVPLRDVMAQDPGRDRGRGFKQLCGTFRLV